MIQKPWPENPEIRRLDPQYEQLSPLQLQNLLVLMPKMLFITVSYPGTKITIVSKISLIKIYAIIIFVPSPLNRKSVGPLLAPINNHNSST